MIFRVPFIVPVCFFVASLLLAGCGKNQSKTTETESSRFSSLEEKQGFLEKYVTFRRNYDDLDFWISFRDGGDGRVPAPTEWDVRIVAQVPTEELESWIEGLNEAEKGDQEWLDLVPQAPADLEGFSWYKEGQRIVGLNREKRIVVYRNFAY